MTIKYILHPGTLRHQPGAVTLNAQGLADAYGVSMDECVIADEAHPENNPPGLTHLHMRRDGNYMKVVP